jgi:SAM-dependent methyltransferase
MASTSDLVSSERGFHISNKRGQFDYFDQQLSKPNWRELTILDFGGNVGNLLDDAGPWIDPERYWCIDVVAGAIEIGRQKHPRAHWVHYNRYNCCFNPDGVPSLNLPVLNRTFDYILAYSVFTHVIPSEMQELIADLSSRVNPGGRLAFTFIDPLYHSWPSHSGTNNFRWRLEREWGTSRELVVKEYLTRIEGKSWFALVNDELHFDENAILTCADRNEITFHVYHSVSFIHRLFPTGKILEPVYGEMQHCCILDFRGG